MTQNEVSIVKNSVLDSTEAYVEARLSVLDFVRTQIGVVQEEPVKRSDRKYIHKVKCNATNRTSGITYNNVLSVGNIPFPKDSVVFLIAPNAQYSNQFILGKLDDTPCNISAGSITLGDAIYLSSTPDNTGSYGHLAGFKIYNNELKIGDALLSQLVIGCGRISTSAGTGGIVNMVGGNDRNYISLSNTGDPYDCRNGIRLHGYKDGTTGLLEAYNGNGSKMWDRNLELIPIHNLYYHSDGSVEWY